VESQDDGIPDGEDSGREGREQGGTTTSRWRLYKSVCAKKSFKAGDIVFIEEPLVCMQHIDNAKAIRCCGACLRFVGPSSDHGTLCCQAMDVETRFCDDCGRNSTALAVHKRYMCASSVPGGDALHAFYDLAWQTNDIFILAAKVLFHVLHRADVAKNLEDAWRPYAMGYKMPWWESVARPDDVPVEEEEEFRNGLKQLAEDSFEAFCDLLREVRPEELDRYYGSLLSLEVWGSLVGMFELNNLNIQAMGPEDSDQDGDNSDYGELVEGSGFYSIHSCFNHSCDPNCRVLLPRDDLENAKAIVQVTRDVEEGEELTMSYIEEDEPYAVRQEQLRDYGFECRCQKCLVELEFVVSEV
jgi:hypothetical protein